jgi:hypothetical protein
MALKHERDDGAHGALMDSYVTTWAEAVTKAGVGVPTTANAARVQASTPVLTEARDWTLYESIVRTQVDPSFTGVLRSLNVQSVSVTIGRGRTALAPYTPEWNGSKLYPGRVASFPNVNYLARSRARHFAATTCTVAAVVTADEVISGPGPIVYALENYGAWLAEGRPVEHHIPDYGKVLKPAELLDPAFATRAWLDANASPVPDFATRVQLEASQTCPTVVPVWFDFSGQTWPGPLTLNQAQTPTLYPSWVTVPSWATYMALVYPGALNGQPTIPFAWECVF